jgi:hypothetical protein
MLGLQGQAGYAHLLGELARAFGIQSAAREQPDLGGLRTELIGQVFDTIAVPGQPRSSRSSSWRERNLQEA